ncbi:hypothetical protein Sjap_013632 [Stephania japonica]|uniref:AT1G08220-like protein n=1 Tax=Stephania japonica TaxID=461633 RepID=A0AAP0P059_9MAGN
MTHEYGLLEATMTMESIDVPIDTGLRSRARDESTYRVYTESVLEGRGSTVVPKNSTIYRNCEIYRSEGSSTVLEDMLRACVRPRETEEVSLGRFAEICFLRRSGGLYARSFKLIITRTTALTSPPLEFSPPTGRRSSRLSLCHKDEMNRGYFADISELKKHGGKLISPGPSLVCLSFRASSQKMIESWAVPVSDAFRTSNVFRLYEVSLIDSWFLSLNPIKQLLLRVMRKSKTGENNALERQIVYAFGDHYYFRKSLNILNLLTGYIFLLDGFGRIRWQGSGFATKEELVSLLSCTTLLLEENEMAASKPQ